MPDGTRYRFQNAVGHLGRCVSITDRNGNRIIINRHTDPLDPAHITTDYVDQLGRTVKVEQNAPDPANPLGFAVWHKDLPYEVPLSPQTTGHWYDRTRRQALDKVVANLQGNCSREAWEFAS